MMRERSLWCVYPLLTAMAFSACGEDAGGGDETATMATTQATTPLATATSSGSGSPSSPAAGVEPVAMGSSGAVTPVSDPVGQTGAMQMPTVPNPSVSPAEMDGATTSTGQPTTMMPAQMQPGVAPSSGEGMTVQPNGMMTGDMDGETTAEMPTTDTSADEMTGVDAGGPTGMGMPTDEQSQAMLIYTSVCASCHGDNGEGVDGKGPEIQHPVRELGEHVVRNGRQSPDYDEPMPEMGPDAITDEQLDEIWDFLDEQPRPTDGAGLYADFCGHCHGADGNKVPNHGISGADATADGYIQNVRAGHHAGEFDNRNGYMPAMTPDFISDEEITLIAEYIASM